MFVSPNATIITSKTILIFFLILFLLTCYSWSKKRAESNVNAAQGFLILLSLI